MEQQEVFQEEEVRKGFLKGLGLIRSFGEGSRKWGFALEWMLWGSRGKSVIAHCKKPYL